MSWLASWFSPAKSSNNRRNQALSATQDAFSLPTSVFSSNHDAYNADALSTPDADSAMSPSYSYPPQASGGQYGYVSTGSSRSQPPLLPTHNTPLSPIPPYPALEQSWNRIRTWLSNEYPELGDTLNYGILPQDLADVEMQFGFALPQAVRESYLCVDGQEPESSVGCSEGLFFGLTLLPLDEVLDEWRFWREVDSDPSTGAHAKLKELMQSIPPGWIRREYSQRGWIPLITDKTGNYIGVDLNPAEGGAVGQVIIFGRDFDTKVVLWRGDGPAGWARWLANFAEELENREGFEMGDHESEGSEDDLGYESYFFDGTGRGSGDGNGDSSAGGLRLTGEYRGWSALEAWADKSVRKWHETGVITDESLQQEKGKTPERMGLGVLELAAKASNSSAEVPIPVFADASNKDRPPLHGIGEDAEPEVEAEVETIKPPVPTISVTKPPAPLPLVLPTQSDIIRSPLESARSLSLDLEEGGGVLMEEIDHPPTSVPPTQTQPARILPVQELVSEPTEATLVAISSPPAVSSSSSPKAVEPIPLPAPKAAPLADITDLLADSAPSLDAPAIEPSPSPSTLVLEVSAPEPEPEAEADHESEHESFEDPVVINSAGEEVVSEEEETDGHKTVRLIGGGGTSGIVEDATPAAESAHVIGDSENADVASLKSVTSVESSASKRDSKSEKKKSIVGLKNLSRLAGKRKKDSASSIKDAI
ncbi:hypothetical protein EWM64_g774 [Hericium alpestre]|uniref:Knr4/Smi1-like domain-containing protein n=1 Tax=Hericium alpestre TaxID=135208 RepID=A0A4Z0A9M5_9AGAM|nr:hypothetical protein EWM64_g774 [Hericium alpestre]